VKSFNGMGSFIHHLRTLQAHATRDIELALGEAGKLVQDQAKNFIGEYQPSVGPFPVWPELAETTLYGYTDKHGHTHPGKVELGYSPPDNPLKRHEDLRNAIDMSYNAVKAVVGVPDEVVGDGTPGNLVRNIGDIAIDHEFGTHEMPERSFLGRALFVRTQDVVDIIGYAVQCIIAGVPHKPHSGQKSHHEPP
jgi:hypothetical protein